MHSSATSHGRTPFGLKAGRIYSAAEVDSGLGCGCICPQCGAALIAKKGEMVAWHFAHHNSSASLSCLESAIHAAAKQVLLDARWLEVPEMRVTVSESTKAGGRHSRTSILSRARTIRFDYCKEEMWESTIRPDVVGYRGARKFLVEMYFTHKVDADKRKKLIALGIPSLEIDLSNLGADVSFDIVKERVLENLVHKEWLFYPGEKEAREALLVTVREEAALLDFAFDKRQAAEARRVEAINAEERRVRQAIADANERYRILPLVDKERLLRESLKFTGTWPYHLNKESPEAEAIAEPARIWQAALFARFVHDKRDEDSCLDVNTLSVWVVSRFGLTPGKKYDTVVLAVKKYLGYLRACGFLARDSNGPGYAAYYKVVHDGLRPPPRPEQPVLLTAPVKAESLLQRSPAQVVSAQGVSAPVHDFRQGGFASDSWAPIIKTHWIWAEQWPSPQEAKSLASDLLKTSRYHDVLLREVESLTPSSRPNAPLVTAILLEHQGVPRAFTLGFLVGVGMAIKTMRTI